MTTATEIVAPRMQALRQLEKTLKRLDLSWKVIETTARIVNPPEAVGFIATLEHTRTSFSRLAAEMVGQIAQTHLTNCQHDLASRAQVAIDILVRNLFERTADVGFIATDAPLVEFVQSSSTEQRHSLHKRLTEYRNKYTVYDDILVLDASAQLMLPLQSRNPEPLEPPTWWASALLQPGYVEHYGPSSLFPHADHVLLYAHRVVSNDGAACGAVVLKFDLQSELVSIFKALQHKSCVIAVLDADGCVLASSHADSLAPMDTVRIPKTGTATGQTLQHLGVDYLFAHCVTRGYQGYSGPGWSTIALVRLDEAFESASSNPVQRSENRPRKGTEVSASIELEHAELQHIVARAKAIEEDLNRVIWNGKLNESGNTQGSALGPIFLEIGRISKQTITAFDTAILELKNLLLVGKHAELASHAMLAVDIMDRNLYERANDCRWWALSEELADLLHSLEDAPSDAAVERAGEILAHLNNLYTVYRRVALFDRHGRIVAVSRDAQTLPTDSSIPAALLKRTLDLQGTQAYAVSSMVPHALADGEASYLYCAPIRKAGEARPLGGVALAFNCADELKAMLQDSLPVGSDTTRGYFLDPDGRVLASTDPQLAVGDVLDSAAQPWCTWNAQAFLLGQAQSKGYREFKTSDGYQNKVCAVMLSPVKPCTAVAKGFALPQPLIDLSDASPHYGVVQCGTILFALGSEHVLEAVSAHDITAPAVKSDAVGMLKFPSGGQLLVVPVYDMCKLLGQAPITTPNQGVAIVVRSVGQTVALLVNRLIDVIACDTVEPPPSGFNPQAPWISGLIHDDQPHSEAVCVINPIEFPMFKSPTHIGFTQEREHSDAVPA